MFNFFKKDKKKEDISMVYEAEIKPEKDLLVKKELINRILALKEHFKKEEKILSMQKKNTHSTEVTIKSQKNWSNPNEPVVQKEKINDIDQLLKEGDESIGLMTEMIFSMSLLSSETENSIKYLVETINDIYKIVVSIQDISNYTALISLNASIESSRKEGSNQTFHIISSEIKKLADKTKKLTNEILSFKERIDAEAYGTKKIIAEENNLINGIVEQIEISSSSFQKMAISTVDSTKTIEECHERIAKLNEIIAMKTNELVESERINKNLEEKYQHLSKQHKKQQLLINEFLASEELHNFLDSTKEG